MQRTLKTRFLQSALWLGFWILVGGFYTAYFGRESANYRGSLYLVAVLLPVSAATSHVIADVLIPRYLLAGRKWMFGLYSAYVLILAVYVELFALLALFVFVADYRISALNPEVLDFMGMLVAFHVVVMLVVTIRLVQQAYSLRDRNQKAENLRLETELKLREAEVGLLKGQIHPHFLFNSLNNLYALTLAGSDRAPDTVLRLSEMLDYVLYRSQTEVAVLADELSFIQSYLAMEQLRFGDRLKLDIQLPDPVPDISVAPLLLLPLVENAIKHGLRPDTTDCVIKLSLESSGEQTRFHVQNSVPALAPATSESGGFGLANLKQRLNLLYPDRHALTLERRTDEFLASLEWSHA
jgi:sensor histidine kinase YesM